MEFHFISNPKQMGKITFTNFRCFTDRTFTFPEHGLILVDGESGSGKSTLIQGILHALYGKLKKPTHFLLPNGSSKVELEWFGCNIIRSSKPNVLKFTFADLQLEDDPAQSEIDKRFGTFDEFLISSYIPQKNNTSILSLTPLEQLKLVQTIAFDADSSEKRKDKIKEMIRLSTKRILELEMELKFSNTELDKISIPVQLSELSNTQMETTKSFLTNYPEQLSHLLEQQSALSKQEKEYEKYTKYNVLANEINSIQIQGFDPNDLIQLQSRLVHAKKRDQYLQWEAELAELKQKEMEELTELIKEKEAKNWKERSKLMCSQELEKLNDQQELYTKYQQQEKIISEISKEFKLTGNLTKILKDRLQQVQTSINSLENQLNNHVKMMELAEIQLTLMKCPNCDQSLRCDLIQHQLIPFENQAQDFSEYTPEKLKVLTKDKRDLNDQKMKLERALNKLDFEAVNKVENPGLAITKLQSYISKHEYLEMEISQLKEKYTNEEYSLAVKSLEKKMGLLTFSDEEEEVVRLEEQIQSLQQLSGKHAELLKRKAQIELEIKQLGPVKKSTFSPKKRTEIESQLQKIQQDYQYHTQFQIEINKYLHYQQVKAQIADWNTKISTLQTSLKNTEIQHTALLKLKQRYIEAELIAIRSTITSINSCTAHFLDQFFTEHHLTAVLTSIEDGKIATELTYKNHRYESISQLSGGEFDKCTLASVCGINSLLSSNVLILDESLASLDTENNTDILTFLHDLGSEKLILVCSHEATRGIFDHILEIEQ